MKTLAERLDEEEKALDEQERLSTRIAEALERGRRRVAELRERRPYALDLSLDHLRIR